MSNILSFGKIEDKPTAEGDAKCLDCKYEWVAIIETPYDSSLECPKCKSFRGGLTTPMAPNENTIVYKCNCGCNHFWVVNNGILCVGCGAVTTFSELDNALD